VHTNGQSEKRSAELVRVPSTELSTLVQVEIELARLLARS
jgi:hypothetical protein